MLNATGINLLLVPAALAEVLQIHDSTGSAWDSVHMVLAAGHLVVGGLKELQMCLQVYVAVVSLQLLLRNRKGALKLIYAGHATKP